MKIDEQKLAEMQVVHGLMNAEWAFLGYCAKCRGNDAYKPTEWFQGEPTSGTVYCLGSVAKDNVLDSSFRTLVRSLGLEVDDAGRLQGVYKGHKNGLPPF